MLTFFVLNIFFQFVQDENFKDLQVTDKDFLEDHDSDVEEDLSNGDPFQIIMISDAYRYLFCPSQGKLKCSRHLLLYINYIYINSYNDQLNILGKVLKIINKVFLIAVDLILSTGS